MESSQVGLVLKVRARSRPAMVHIRVVLELALLLELWVRAGEVLPVRVHIVLRLVLRWEESERNGDILSVLWRHHGRVHLRNSKEGRASVAREAGDLAAPAEAVEAELCVALTLERRGHTLHVLKAVRDRTDRAEPLAKLLLLLVAARREALHRPRLTTQEVGHENGHLERLRELVGALLRRHVVTKDIIDADNSLRTASWASHVRLDTADLLVRALRLVVRLNGSNRAASLVHRTHDV